MGLLTNGCEYVTFRCEYLSTAAHEGQLMLSMSRGPDILVASGATDSNPVRLEDSFGDSVYVTFVSPDTLPETATIQVSVDFNTSYVNDGITLAAAIAAAHWDTPPAGVTLGTAGALTNFLAGLLTAAAFRVHLSGSAAANRTFITYKQSEIT